MRISALGRPKGCPSLKYTLGPFAPQKGLDTLDKGTTIRIVLLAAVFVLGAASAVRADVVFVGPADIGETGFRNLNSITTMQATDDNQDQTDSDMNQEENNGDDEKGPSDKDTDNEGDGGHDDDSPRSFTPEPASLLLLGTGICLFGGLLRRRLLSA